MVKDTRCVWDYRGLSLAENPMKGVAIKQKVIPLSMVAQKSHNKNESFQKRNHKAKPQFQSSCWHSCWQLADTVEKPIWWGPEVLPRASLGFDEPHLGSKTQANASTS